MKPRFNLNTIAFAFALAVLVYSVATQQLQAQQNAQFLELQAQQIRTLENQNAQYKTQFFATGQAKNVAGMSKSVSVSDEILTVTVAKLGVVNIKKQSATAITVSCLAVGQDTEFSVSTKTFVHLYRVSCRTPGRIDLKLTESI